MYFGGLDLGTSSVGWALTDENYNLIRRKGKDLWGVRLFDEAESAQNRRVNRVSRRRRTRELARIGMLKEYFADEINKIDSGFYPRLEESKYHVEDKKTEGKYALFADATFTDKEYFEDYPTIFHLRKELIESAEKYDIRLIYLAILNMFKHRGHFLNDYLIMEDNEESIDDLYRNLICSLPDELELVFPNLADGINIEEILGSKEFSRNEKAEKLADCIGVKKSQHKAEYELIKMMCGLSGRLSVIFGKEWLGEEYAKIQLSFRDGSYDEKIDILREILSDEFLEMIELIKKIHDKGLLSNILKGHTYLSHAFVESYDKHAYDLQVLRSVIKKYCMEEYDGFFRKMADNNYSGYIGSVNFNKEKTRRSNKASKDVYKLFWNEIKRLLACMPEDDEDVYYLKRELSKETLLPKQRTFENGIIPNQVHLMELKKILSNAERYYSFLTETDEYGLTVSQRIIRLFQFQIPYYVGPLHINDGETDRKWVQRKEKGKVFPWNIEEKVDMAKTREAFIVRMVRRCSYMEGKYVLPKSSLLYEKFLVLNELNNVKVYGKKLGVQLKQDIYRELFCLGKKVTMKKFSQWLQLKGLIKPGENNVITGIDGEFQHALVSLGRFESVLGKDASKWEYQKMAEQIIFWGTVYSNDKKVMRELISKEYGVQSDKKYLTEEQIKRILGYKWKDWGKLSKDFLELEGYVKEIGMKITLIQAMWETEYNLMELLSSENTFMDTLKENTRKRELLLEEFSYKDLENRYLSAPVKRMTWQTVLIMKELCQIMGEAPKRLFVEMPRKDGKKGNRTVSRKKKFEELYKKCKEDSRDWLNEIEGLSEDALRSKKLYLYYMQKGKCMYTGHSISLEDLLTNNNQYDIDHIYPRHFIKDDSLQNNLVLVEKESNGHKSDTFPIEVSIQKERYGLWKSLLDGGFITQEKYKRLTRTWEFSDEELADFINRQIVETGQAAKYTAHLLEQLLPDTEIVYVKSGNVSDFRHKRELLKSRVVNDFHHAQDAYLNIVVGNVYYMKFTKSPINFIKEYKNNGINNSYHMDKMFEYDVVRNDEIAWKAGKSGTIVTVKSIMAKNSPLLTKRTYEAHGGIANQTIYSSKVANRENYIPLKERDERLCDVEKYGGFTSVSGTYYFLVEHERKGKRVRTLEQMPIYLKERLEKDEDELIEYCHERLGLLNPNIRLKKIPMQSLVRRNGYLLNLAGKTGNQIYADNAVSLCLSRRWINYVKRMENFKEYEKEQDYVKNIQLQISPENNIALYQELMWKHCNTIYQKKPNPLSEKIRSKEERFSKLSVKEQVNVLLELLKATQCQNLGVAAKELELNASPGKINNDVSSQEEFVLIYQSVTGIYIHEIDLRTI